MAQQAWRKNRKRSPNTLKCSVSPHSERDRERVSRIDNAPAGNCLLFITVLYFRGGHQRVKVSLAGTHVLAFFSVLLSSLRAVGNHNPSLNQYHNKYLQCARIIPRKRSHIQLVINCVTRACSDR